MNYNIINVIESSKTIKIIRNILKCLVIITFVLLVSMTFLQVISRYISHKPLTWTEEIVRFSNVWLALLTSSICIHEKKHLSLDFLTHSLSFKLKKILNILIYSFFILGFLIILLIYGIQFTVKGASQLSPAMRLPMSIIYTILPISAILMILESIFFINNTFQEKEIVEKNSGGQ